MTKKLTRIGPVAGLLVIAALAGCGSESETGGAGQASSSFEDCTVTQIPKTTDNPYFAAAQAGMAEAQGEIGGKLEFVGPAAGDVPGQIQRIQSASQQGSCAVGVAALDATAVAPALDAASDRGAQVLTWDADVTPDSRCLFVNQAEAEALGVSQFEILAEAMGNEGDYAIISAQSGAANQNAWIEAMDKEQQQPEYAGMKLLKTTYGDDDSKKSYDLAVSLIRAYPDLDAIMAPTPVALEAAVKATKDQGVQDDVVITGLGFPGTQKQLLTDGDVPAYVLWSPRDLGYLTYYATKALVEGEVTCDGGTFQAGRLGERTVSPEGEVLLGEPITFTPENVSDFDRDFAPAS